jgi:hypothetical protein
VACCCAISPTRYSNRTPKKVGRLPLFTDVPRSVFSETVLSVLEILGFAGIAPTGNRVTLPGMEIVRISDGKLVEGWEGYDSMTMMRQLSVM